MVLKEFDEVYRKYKYMDSTLSQKHRMLKSKIPDIQASLEMVEFLIDRNVCVSMISDSFIY